MRWCCSPLSLDYSCLAQKSRTNRRDEKIAAQAAATNELGELEDRVKGVLSNEPVKTMDYLKYHNFAHTVLARRKRYPGGYALFGEVQMLIDEYTARDCIESVLEKIRDDVFAIQAPKKSRPATQAGCTGTKPAP